MPSDTTAPRTALVVGATGITGRALTRRLVASGWEVVGLSRRAVSDIAGVRSVTADLQDRDSLAAALQG
eukprot:gene37732-42738_t